MFVLFAFIVVIGVCWLFHDLSRREETRVMWNGVAGLTAVLAVDYAMFLIAAHYVSLLFK